MVLVVYATLHALDLCQTLALLKNRDIDRQALFSRRALPYGVTTEYRQLMFIYMFVYTRINQCIWACSVYIMHEQPSFDRDPSLALSNTGNERVLERVSIS